LATDARLTVEYVFTAPDGSKDSMTVVGESRDWADKATNQAMSAGYKTGLLQMFLIPLEETQDADAASPVGAPAESEKEDDPEVSDEEKARLHENAAKVELVEILGGGTEAAEFWERHPSLSPDEMLVEARRISGGDDE
jgi:hypothetical protein